MERVVPIDHSDVIAGIDEDSPQLRLLGRTVEIVVKVLSGIPGETHQFFIGDLVAKLHEAGDD
jgi:hypothetical protein